jgi:SOS response regulatory protein OraA/RecX
VRPRGRAELVRSLIDRGFGREAATRAAGRLESEGWLDDLAAARSAARVRGARYGRARLQRDLSARGFDRETIAAALDAELPEREGPALARAFARLWERHAALPLRERRQKVRAALSRRGFASAAISEMMRSSHEIR